MARKLRTTLPDAAKSVADKYIGPKGGKSKAKDKPAGEFELSAESLAKKGAPPPEVRIVHVRPKAPKITDKEWLFIEHYTGDCAFNGAEAARKAGFSEKNARHTAYELLTKPHIKAAVEHARRERMRRIEFDSDQLLRDLIAEHRADIAEIYNEDNTLKPIHEWPLEFRTGLVAGVETEDIFAGSGEEKVKIGEVQKVKLTDRIAIKRMIGQHLAIQAFRKFANLDEPKAGTLVDELRRMTEGTGLRPKEIEATARPVPPTMPAVGGLRPRE